MVSGLVGDHVDRVRLNATVDAAGIGIENAGTGIAGTGIENAGIENAGIVVAAAVAGRG